MCSVSMVMDYGKHQFWPMIQPQIQPGLPGIPYQSPNVLKELQEQREAIKKFQELYEAAKRFDEAAKQRDCEDVEKIQLLKKINDRLELIEKHLGLES